MTPKDRAEALERFLFGPAQPTGDQRIGRSMVDMLADSIRAAILEEREACAKVAEDLPVENGEKWRVKQTIAAAIRARI